MSKNQLQYQIEIAKRNLLVLLAEMERGVDCTEQVKQQSEKLAKLFLEWKGGEHA